MPFHGARMRLTLSASWKVGVETSHAASIAAAINASSSGRTAKVPSGRRRRSPTVALNEVCSARAGTKLAGARCRSQV